MRVCSLNGIRQLLVYADDIHTLGGSIHSIQKNAGALVIASKETGLEVNAEKTKYMILVFKLSPCSKSNLFLFG